MTEKGASRSADNEALVIRIQRGESLMPLLWSGMERLVWWLANKLIRRLPASLGVEVDDIAQCGYLALIAAVEGWDSTHAGTFNSYFYRCFQTECARQFGYRTKTQQQDPLNIKQTRRFEEELAEDYTLGETIANPDDDMPTVEQVVYTRQLRKVLDRAISKLDDRTGSVMRGYYLEGRSTGNLAAQEGCGINYIAQLRRQGLAGLRRSRELRKYVEDNTDYSLHVGVSRYQNTHTSAVEELVFQRERLAREWKVEKKKPTRAKMGNVPDPPELAD